MDTKEIIVKIQGALKRSSEDSKIDRNDIRIKLSVTKGFVKNDVRLTLMNKTNNIHDLDMKSLLSINMIQSALVNTFLSNTLLKLGSEIGAKDEDVNAKIATRTEDFYPVVYLFNGGKYIREITMEELIS